MFPYLHIGNLHIPTFAVFVTLGVVACAVYAIVTLKCVEKADRALILKTLGVLAPSLFFMYVFASAFDTLFHSLQEGRFMAGGITWEGGVVGGFTAFVICTHFWIREKKGRALEYFSLLIPGIVLGHAFGRIGCFMGGCCFGKISFTMGVRFPAGSPAALQYPSNLETSLPVLPTQLYEAAFEFALFAVMLILYKRFRTYNLELYCVAYGVFRFVLEFFRGDDRGGTGFFLSPSQLMSIVLVVAGVLIFLYKKNIIFKKLYKKAEGWRAAATDAGIETREEILACIDELHELCERGALTQEEFEAKKKELLRRL